MPSSSPPWSKPYFTKDHFKGGRSLRTQRYHAIAAANPSKAEYLPVWLSRVESLRAMIGGEQAAPRNDRWVDRRIDGWGEEADYRYTRRRTVWPQDAWDE